MSQLQLTERSEISCYARCHIPHGFTVYKYTVLSHLIHTYELSEKERQGLPKYELSECMN